MPRIMRIVAWVFVPVMAAAWGCQATQAERAADIGDQLASTATPLATASADPVDRGMGALERMRGSWSVEGWVRPVGGTRVPARGRAVGEVQHRHFLSLGIDLATGEPGTTTMTDGIMHFGYERGRGIRMTSWFASSPAKRHFTGVANQPGTVIVLDQDRAVGGADRQRVVITFPSDDQWRITIEDPSAPGAPEIAEYVLSRSVSAGPPRRGERRR